MKKIILVPIEPLDARYSIQWLAWFTKVITEDSRFDLIVVDPEPLTTDIESGAFLDVVGTNYYKAAQIQELCKLIYAGTITEDDTILLLDGWFPGVEALAYMRDGLQRNFKIAGCFHAGTYDASDFISKMGMGVWGEDLENCWFSMYDSVFVATEYHKDLICYNRKVNPYKIHVTGFPIYFDSSNHKKWDKRKIVVFPHRLTQDKQPHLFDELAHLLAGEFPDWLFIKTQEGRRSKEDYYELLSRSSIAVSFALHENWGIGMQESLFSGCIPIVPNRLSYMEMYPRLYRYNDFEGAVSMTRQLIITLGAMSLTDIDDDCYFKRKWKETVTDLYGKGTSAIPNMLEIIHGI